MPMPGSFLFVLFLCDVLDFGIVVPSITSWAFCFFSLRCVTSCLLFVFMFLACYTAIYTAFYSEPGV